MMPEPMITVVVSGRLVGWVKGLFTMITACGSTVLSLLVGKLARQAGKAGLRLRLCASVVMRLVVLYSVLQQERVLIRPVSHRY